MGKQTAPSKLFVTNPFCPKAAHKEKIYFNNDPKHASNSIKTEPQKRKIKVLKWRESPIEKPSRKNIHMYTLWQRRAAEEPDHRVECVTKFKNISSRRLVSDLRITAVHSTQEHSHSRLSLSYFLSSFISETFLSVWPQTLRFFLI